MQHQTTDPQSPASASGQDPTGPGLKVKVCGLRERNNIAEVAQLQPDLMGFILYAPSKRYAGHMLRPEDLSALSAQSQKVGVFVNPSLEEVKAAVAKYGFEAVQLHGDESPAFCQQVQTLGVTLIKAFGIAPGFDFNALTDYQKRVDFFLFDTKSSAFGGTGKTFDWTMLQQYHLSTPFFLSGGIGLNELQAILDQCKGQQWLAKLPLYGIDINSKFEQAPGKKDLKRLQEAFARLRDC